MNEQKIQNTAPIIPVYDEDNLPDECFYPEGLDDPNGPNADAMRATAIGEIIEPEAECASQAPQAKAYDVRVEEVDIPQDEEVWTPQNPENVIVEDLNALDWSEDEPNGMDEYGLDYEAMGIEPPIVADRAGEIL